MGSLACIRCYCSDFSHCRIRIDEVQKNWCFNLCWMGWSHDWFHYYDCLYCSKCVCLLRNYRILWYLDVLYRMENWRDRGNSSHSFHRIIFSCKRSLTLCWWLPFRNNTPRRIISWHRWLVKLPKDILLLSWCHCRYFVSFRLLLNATKKETWKIQRRDEEIH